MQDDEPTSPVNNFHSALTGLNHNPQGINSKTLADLRSAPVSPTQHAAFQQLAQILQNPDLDPAAKERACTDAADLLATTKRPREDLPFNDPDNMAHFRWSITRRKSLSQELTAEARKHSPVNRSTNMEDHLIKQMTDEQGETFRTSKAWETMSHRERAILQLLQQRLWMPFRIFHAAVENTLSRPIPAEQLGLNRSKLINEILNGEPAPTLDQIMAKLPPLLNQQDHTDNA